MTTHYLLIDFENVQPKNLHLVSKHDVKVFAFRGAGQKTIPFDFANDMQNLGSRATYINCEGGKKNAADFHICYYLGKLAQIDPSGVFNVLSKDTGFDPMITHLKGRKIRVFRQPDIEDIPIFKVVGSFAEQVFLVRENLDGRKTSRPRKTSTLLSTVTTLLKHIENASPDKVISALEKAKYISVTDGKITYQKGK